MDMETPTSFQADTVDSHASVGKSRFFFPGGSSDNSGDLRYYRFFAFHADILSSFLNWDVLRSPALMPFKDTAAKVRNGRKLTGCGHLYAGFKRTDRCFTYQMLVWDASKNQQKDGFTASEGLCCQSLESQKLLQQNFEAMGNPMCHRHGTHRLGFWGRWRDFFCPYECAHPLKMNGSNPNFGDLEDDLPLQIGDFDVPALVAFGRVHGVDWYLVVYSVGRTCPTEKRRGNKRYQKSSGICPMIPVLNTKKQSNHDELSTNLPPPPTSRRPLKAWTQTPDID